MTLNKITMVYKYKSIKAFFKNYDKNVEEKKQYGGHAIAANS